MTMTMTAPMTSSTTTAQRWVLILTSAASLMVALDQLVVATALNRLRDDLHASMATLEWTVNAYSLSFAVLLVTGAALGDRFGRRRMFNVGLALFTAASAACALAPNTGLLIAARTVQGAGSALVLPLALALLTAAYPVERRGAAVGIFTALTGLAVVGGPVVGGAVTQGIAWQWIFWINVPLGLVLIPLVATRIGESFGDRARLDLVGVASASLGLLGVVWGLVRAATIGWGSAETIATLVGGGLVTLAFVRWELRTAQPMLPMRLFRVPAFAAGNAASFLLTASLFSTVYFVAQYLQISLGYGPLDAGLRFLPWTTTLFLVAPLAGALADRVGARPLLVAGLTLQGVGIGWVALNVAHDRSYLASVGALVIAGCGTSMALPSGQNAVMNSVAPSALGQASGTFGTMRQLGGVFGIAVLSAVFAATGSYAGPQAFADGVAPALAVAAGLALLGALAGAFVSAPAPATTPTSAELVPVGSRAG